MKRFAAVVMLVMLAGCAGSTQNLGGVMIKAPDIEISPSEQGQVTSIKLNQREVVRMIQDYVDKAYGTPKRQVVSARIAPHARSLEVFVVIQRDQEVEP